MSPKPTKNEADQLIAARKVVSAVVRWQNVGTGLRLEAKVFSAEPRAVFDLHGRVGRTNYSFSVVYLGYPIRKYTKHYCHKSPTRVFRDPHKHTWDEELEDVDAYVPSDIDPKDDINQQFLAFCKECNIELVGGYQHCMMPEQRLS